MAAEFFLVSFVSFQLHSLKLQNASGQAGLGHAGHSSVVYMLAGLTLLERESTAVHVKNARNGVRP